MYNVILHVKLVPQVLMINVLNVKLIERKIQIINVYQKKDIMKIMNQYQVNVINVVKLV